MIVFLFSCLNWFPLTTRGQQLIANNVLQDHYEQLAAFSSEFSFYSQSTENYQLLFWEGLSRSFNFHERSNFLKKNATKTLLKWKRVSETHLTHPFAAPAHVPITYQKGIKCFDRFKGEWHGKWDQITVKHLWLPTCTTLIQLQDQFYLLGFQSCFTGDGFGWNYIVRKNDQIILLGFVYHYDEWAKMTKGNPHFALLNESDQLTWISDTNLYQEHVCIDSACQLGKHYIITGITYSLGRMKLETRSGFQAIYLSRNGKLPSFQLLDSRVFSQKSSTDRLSHIH